MKHVGVDGCGVGWIGVSKDGSELIYRTSATLSGLLSYFPRAERVLVDMPIGLPWCDRPIRPCDQLARAILGTRRSSVFPVPCRPAAHAATQAQARDINRAALGRSLSAQTLGICQKIAEVDSLLLSKKAPSTNIREIHPEVCFWALAGRTAMKNNKRKRPGIDERLDLLRRFEPGVERLLEHVLGEEYRKDVSADDVLDAAVAFVTCRAPKSRLRRLSGTPNTDEKGLPMEMVYLHS